jgi:hypothetical protein
LGIDDEAMVIMTQMDEKVLTPLFIEGPNPPSKQEITV